MLRSGARYHWRVEVWDEAGRWSGAAQTWFETGLLHPDEWTAVWVARDPNSLPHIDPPQPDVPPPADDIDPPPLYLRRGRIHHHVVRQAHGQQHGDRDGDATAVPAPAPALRLAACVAGAGRWRPEVLVGRFATDKLSPAVSATARDR